MYEVLFTKETLACIVDVLISVKLGIDPSVLNAVPPATAPRDQTDSPSNHHTPPQPESAPQSQSTSPPPDTVPAESPPAKQNKESYKKADITNAADNKIRAELDEADALLDKVLFFPLGVNLACFS